MGMIFHRKIKRFLISVIQVQLVQLINETADLDPGCWEIKR